MLGLIKCITRGILKLDPMARFLCKGLGEAVWFQVFLLYPHMALFFVVSALLGSASLIILSPLKK